MTNGHFRELGDYEDWLRARHGYLEEIRTLDPALFDKLDRTINAHTDEMRDRIRAGEDVKVPKLMDFGPTTGA